MEADNYTTEGFDEYLSAKVLLPKGDHMVRGEVVRRRRDSNGNPIGKRNLNPILVTREYEVMDRRSRISQTPLQRIYIPRSMKRGGPLLC
jgi:hypothetical protein